MTFPAAFAYERRTGQDLQTFYDSSIPGIRHPEVRAWATELEAERKEAQQGRAAATIDSLGSSSS